MSSKIVFNIVIFGGTLILLVWTFKLFYWPIFSG